MMLDPAQITAVILAGGRGSRMGGQDKGLVPLAGKPMVEHVIGTIAPQVGQLFINANRNQDIYQAFGYPVISDELEGYQGPLAGILSALGCIQTPYLLTLPCDVPTPPRDLASRLGQALMEQGGELAVVHDGDKLQPAFALIPRSLHNDLEHYLATGKRKLRDWCSSHRLALADYSGQADHFININDEFQLRRFTGRH